MHPDKRIVLFPLLFMLCLAGCRMPPSAQWAAAARTYRLPADTVATMHEGGILSDEALIALEEPMEATYEALMAAETLLGTEDNAAIRKTELVLQMISSIRRRLYADTGQELEQ